MAFEALASVPFPEPGKGEEQRAISNAKALLQ
jgi:hypothetical protein